jgi:Uma2 family endonuclease
MTNINDLDLNGTYTYADYLKWQFDERIELIKGKPYLLTSPGTRHQFVLGQLCFRGLYEFCKERKVELFHAPFDVRLSTNPINELIYNVVQPDISLYLNRNSLDDFGAIKAPDLIIEIISPLIENNAKKEFGIKLKLYEEFKVKEYWVVDAVSNIIFIYTLNENGKYYGLQPFTDEDTITSPLFPALEIDLNEIFENL